ncbi:conserved hypothetical protein [Candidatus Magnetomoraceae bacterium gMMP-13]
MDYSIIIGIFGIIITFVSALLTIWIQYEINLKSYKKIEVLDGTWKGKAIQDFEIAGKEISYEVSLIFNLKRKRRVYGTVKVKIPPEVAAEEDKIYLEFNGGFFKDRFLKIDYRNVNHSVTQFGTMLFELLPSGKQMTGRFVGFGYFSKKIIYGSIDLKQIW